MSGAVAHKVSLIYCMTKQIFLQIVENALYKGSLHLCLVGRQQGSAMHSGLGTCFILRSEILI